MAQAGRVAKEKRILERQLSQTDAVT